MKSIVLVAALLVTGCKSNEEVLVDKWKAYAQNVVNSGVLDTQWEKFNTALAKGDAKALEGLFDETVNEVGVSGTWHYATYTRAEVIELQLAEFAACDLVGTHDQLFQLARVDGVGLRNARLAQANAAVDRDPPKGPWMELPAEGMWLYATPLPEVRDAFARCGMTYPPFAMIVFAPSEANKKDWRVIGWAVCRRNPPANADGSDSEMITIDK